MDDKTMDVIRSESINQIEYLYGFTFKITCSIGGMLLQLGFDSELDNLCF